MIKEFLFGLGTVFGFSIMAAVLYLSIIFLLPLMIVLLPITLIMLFFAVVCGFIYAIGKAGLILFNNKK